MTMKRVIANLKTELQKG